VWFVCFFFKVRYSEFDITLPVVKRVQHLVRKVHDIITRDTGSSETRKEEVTLLPTERKVTVDMTKVFTPAEDQKPSDFVQKLVKNGTFFSGDKEVIAAPISVSSDSLLLKLLDPDSSTKQTKKKTRKKSLMPAEDQKPSDFVRHMLESKSFLSSDEEITTAQTSESSDNLLKLIDPDASAKNTKKKKTKSPNEETVSAVAAETSKSSSDVASAVIEIMKVKPRTRKKRTTKSPDVNVDTLSAAESSNTASDSASAVSAAKSKVHQKKTKTTASDELAQLS